MSDQFRLEVLTIQTQYNASFIGKCLNYSDICSRNKHESLKGVCFFFVKSTSEPFLCLCHAAD
ncbi:hypothetical protein Hanom_Chr16g01484761 [Helianthus anomalus]